MGFMENKDKGYVSIYRSLCEHFLYPNHREFTELEAWLDLLLTANYADKTILVNMSPVVVSRGNKFTSEVQLATRWFWSRDKVRSFLKMLEREFMITKKSTTKYTIITILNYDSYQQQPTTKKQQTHNNTTTEQQQPHTYNKDNKDNKENKVIPFAGWRDDYQIYLAYAKDGFRKAYEDDSLIEELESYYPKLDIRKSMEASYRSYWGSEDGWEKKKERKSKTIAWRATICRSLEKNKVYKQDK